MSYVAKYLAAASSGKPNSDSLEKAANELLDKKASELNISKEECARMLLVARQGAEEWLLEAASKNANI